MTTTAINRMCCIVIKQKTTHLISFNCNSTFTVRFVFVLSTNYIHPRKVINVISLHPSLKLTPTTILSPICAVLLLLYGVYSIIIFSSSSWLVHIMIPPTRLCFIQYPNNPQYPPGRSLRGLVYCTHFGMVEQTSTQNNNNKANVKLDFWFVRPSVPLGGGVLLN